MSTFFLFSAVFFFVSGFFFLLAAGGFFTRDKKYSEIMQEKPIYLLAVLASAIGNSIAIGVLQHGDFLSYADRAYLKARSAYDLYAFFSYEKAVSASLYDAQTYVVVCVCLVCVFSLLFLIARSLQLKAQD